MPRRLDPTRIRRLAGSYLAEGFFRGLSGLGQLHPRARLSRHGVRAERNLSYRRVGGTELRLDVYRPTERAGPWPVVLYVHGGGFRILSKDTHWLMGLIFARRGYLVFNVDYRLAPDHPFPAAVQDVCDALRWVVEHAAEHGGDLSRLVFAGESAGANLVTSLTLATCFRRPEPYARAAHELDVVPRAVLPICGMLQVSDAERFARRRPLSTFIADRLHEVSRAYLPDPERVGETLALADPLTFLEGDTPPDRPLPPFLAAVGTKDPLLDDTRRLRAALDRRGVECRDLYYPGEIHAFHAFIWRKQARQCWQEQLAFAERHLR